MVTRDPYNLNGPISGPRNQQIADELCRAEGAMMTDHTPRDFHICDNWSSGPWAHPVRRKARYLPSLATVAMLLLMFIALLIAISTWSAISADSALVYFIDANQRHYECPTVQC